ncbi:hypothetical protein H072_5138 [Dactylellina haptotyla CBS 200.50]|uniref:Uncharacterized protein n=1 Tax=Dactylellina haptotyla (strain CBS 200.50) TaxID=1284197 RepID=S8ADH2_DACHA|nr:hypothetical protein H072_5138 [Dactylellina haptotyla CBS 200.50]
MAHAAKRPRLHGPKNPALTLASTASLLESSRQSTTAAAPKLRNLQLEHENSLRQSAQRLKSSWEDICRRYARDFEGEGDEIDLETGNVVVDNGHLRNLSENQDDTWAMDGFDEEDAGSATSSLEMEILGMRPILGRDEMGGPMLKDDEAEEIDVDEMEVDRDAIDDLFDELEELTMTASVKSKLEEKKRREKDQQKSQELELLSNSIPKDSMPSPASSEPADEASSHMKAVVEDMQKDNVEMPSPDELPSDNVIMEKFGSRWGPAVLAYVRTLAENSKPVESENTAFASQLTPVSECGKPLAEMLVDEADKLAALEERSPKAVTEMPSEVEARVGRDVDELEMLAGTILDEMELPVVEIQVPVEPVVAVEYTLEDFVQGILDEVVADTNLDIFASGMIRDEAPEPPTEPVAGTSQQSLVLENALEPAPKLPELTTQSDQAPVTEQLVEDAPTPEEPILEALNPEPKSVMDEGESISKDTEPNPDYLYGDIDDLSTIILPKALAPVTPKNRLRGSKSQASLLRKAVSTGKRGRPKRRLSDTETPPAKSVSKRKPPQTLPPRPKQPVFNTNAPPTSSRNHVEPQKPRSFWSALPDDPFYDAMWQDAHPDGEPDFKEFERRRILLEDHKVKHREQENSVDDDLMLIASSPVTVKKTPKSKTQRTPGTKGRKTPKSMQRAKQDEDSFERKLHTPRSGKFLEYLQKRLVGEKDGVKAEEGAVENEGLESTVKTEEEAAAAAAAAVEMPIRKVKNEYGLSDSEDELAREVWFVKDRDVEIVGTRKQKRSRRPKERAPPLVVHDTPDPSSPIKARSEIKTEEAEEADPNRKPFASCGDSGYRCEKTICFTCIEDWDS